MRTRVEAGRQVVRYYLYYLWTFAISKRVYTACFVFICFVCLVYLMNGGLGLFLAVIGSFLFL